MQAARALIAARPQRGRRSATPWIVLGSLVAHGVILGGLVAGVRVMPPRVEPPALSVELLQVEEPAPPRVEDAAKPVAATSTRPVAPRAAPVVPRVVATPAPSAAAAPPGFTAQGLTGGGDALRQAAREGIGCRNADELALTKAERAACAEALGEKNKNRPAMYAVIDPAKKAAFDGDCRKDDDWCLYRSGKGPYPGILALGKKRKIKGWD